MEYNHGSKSQVRRMIEGGTVVGAVIVFENGVVYICRFGKPLKVRHRISTGEIERLCRVHTHPSEEKKKRVPLRAPVVACILPLRKLNSCA